MEIKSVEDFEKALAQGPYTSVGGYPTYFLCNDCETLSFKAAQENKELIIEAITTKDKHSGWLVVGFDVNWEDNEMYCVDTGDKIECAYPGQCLFSL